MYRHRLTCPECRKPIETPFGSEGVDDQFACPACSKPVAMTLAERVERIARRHGGRGMVLVYLLLAGACIALSVKALVPTSLPGGVALGVLLGLMAGYVVHEYRVDLVRNRLWDDVEARGGSRPPPGHRVQFTDI